jgi:hypothetical protein
VFDGGSHIKGTILHGGQNQVTGGMKGGSGDILLPGTYDHLVDSTAVGPAGLAKAAGETGQILQLQGNVFQDMAWPGALFYPTQEAASFSIAAAVVFQGGEPRRQTLIESGYGAGVGIFQAMDIDPGLQHRTVSPHVGAA